jgi:hypothetical protein
MSREEVLQLPVTFSVVVAGRALGLGSEKTRIMCRRGEFPIKVLPFGRRLMCRRADLFAYLGIDPAGTLEGTQPTSDKPPESLPVPVSTETTAYVLVAIPVHLADPGASWTLVQPPPK